MDCYFIDLFPLYHDHPSSWCDATQKVRPWNHQNQPCHGYMSIITKSNASDPFHMIVSCCVPRGLANFVFVGQMWPTACTTVRPGVYPISHSTWLIVVSLLTFNPLRIERPFSMHFLCRIKHHPLLFIVVSFVEVPSKVKICFISPPKKWWKSWDVGQKRTPFPSPNDRNHSPILVDCCIVCFRSLLPLGIELLPWEPPRIGTPMYVTK